MSVYIIAEISLNWNGDLETAFRLADAAKAAGCQAVKVQNYKTESFIHERAEFYEYQTADGVWMRERQYDMFKAHEWNFSQLSAMAAYCAKIGIDFSSTPMCKEGVDELVKLGVPWIKNGSDKLQDLELIEYMANTEKPVIISTGMANIEEILRASDALYEFSSLPAKSHALLHCVSAYPANEKDMNLSKIDSLKEFGHRVGLSDHTNSELAPALSVAYGASIIERHMTLDKNQKGADHAMSADPSEMAELVRNVRRAEKMIGSPKLGMTETEKTNRSKWFKNA